MKTVKKVRVTAKLAKRQFVQADSTDKVGVVIVGSVILPLLTFICFNIQYATYNF